MSGGVRGGRGDPAAYSMPEEEGREAYSSRKLAVIKYGLPLCCSAVVRVLCRRQGPAGSSSTKLALRDLVLSSWEDATSSL